MLGMTATLTSEDLNFTFEEERTVFNLRSSINKAVSESTSPIFSSSSSPRRSHSNDVDDIINNRNKISNNGNTNSRHNHGNNVNYVNSIGKRNNQYDSNSYNVFTPVISATSTSTSSAIVSRAGIGYSQPRIVTDIKNNNNIKNNNDIKNHSNDSNNDNNHDNDNNNDNNNNDDNNDDYNYFIASSSNSNSAQQNTQKASRMSMRPLSLSLLLPNSILSPIFEIRTAPISPLFSPISVTDPIMVNETSVILNNVNIGEADKDGLEKCDYTDKNGNKIKEITNDTKYKKKIELLDLFSFAVDEQINILR